MPFPDQDTLATYGGAMANYAPVEDPTTDLDATKFTKMSSSTAALTHVSPRAWAQFVGDGTTPTIANDKHDSAWGNGSGVKPTIAKIGTGHNRIIWPATVANEFGGTSSVNLRVAFANVEGATNYRVQCTPAANVVDIYIFDAGGSANNGVGVTFDVLAI